MTGKCNIVVANTWTNLEVRYVKVKSDIQNIKYVQRVKQKVFVNAAL